MDTVEEIQAAYIADLRALLPDLFAWWKQLAGVEDMNDPPPPDVAARWPTGISGHPRLLDVFQTYFFELDELNERALEGARLADRTQARDVPESEASAEATAPIPTGTYRPVDVLINDIGPMAPDLAKLVQGIIMIPVGLDPDEEFF